MRRRGSSTFGVSAGSGGANGRKRRSSGVIAKEGIEHLCPKPTRYTMLYDICMNVKYLLLIPKTAEISS